jgi:hypothetical protein
VKQKVALKEKKNLRTQINGNLTIYISSADAIKKNHCTAFV